MEFLKNLKDTKALDILTTFNDEIINYKENETFNISTKAIIKANGKELDVNLELNLNRSFATYMSMKEYNAIFADPLVISLNGDMPKLSNKSMIFDIDANGEVDQISRLGTNSGF